MKGGPVLHLERFALVMGQNEDRGVEGRDSRPTIPSRAPPPGASNRAEHVAAHDHGAITGLQLLSYTSTGIDFPTMFSVSLTPEFQLDEPVVEIHATDAQRILLGWFGPAT